MSSLAERSWARRRLLDALLVVVTLLTVMLVWRAREEPLEAGVKHTAIASGLRPDAARPPSTLRLDLGGPAGRAFVVSGFDQYTTAEGRTVGRTSGSHSVLGLTLAPDAEADELIALARTAPGMPNTAVELRVNDFSVAKLDVGSDWSLRHVEVPARFLVGGKNQFEWRPLGGGSVLLDRLWIAPRSARVELDLGAYDMPSISGFGPGELIEGHHVAPLAKPEGGLSITLNPIATDYVLGFLGRSSDESTQRADLFVNHLSVGAFAVEPRWQPSYVRVRRSTLHVGTNSIALVATAGRPLVERVALVPIEQALLLDLGTDTSRMNLNAGFSANERSPNEDSVWSEGSISKLAFWLLPLPRPYRLSLRVHTLAPLAPLAVQVELNGKALPALRVGSTFAVHEMNVDAGLLIDGQNELVFKYAATKQPRAFLPRSADARELGVSFDWLELDPSVQ